MTRSKKHGPLGVLTHEESLTIVGSILDMQNCGLTITLQQFKLKVKKIAHTHLTTFMGFLDTPDGTSSNIGI
jgi:hypothetical protein